jgi:hypothetical protein
VIKAAGAAVFKVRTGSLTSSSTLLMLSYPEYAKDILKKEVAKVPKDQSEPAHSEDQDENGEGALARS